MSVQPFLYPLLYILRTGKYTFGRWMICCYYRHLYIVGDSAELRYLHVVRRVYMDSTSFHSLPDAFLFLMYVYEKIKTKQKTDI